MKNILDIELHMRSFTDAFILEARKDKWTGLLCERPANVFNQSSKLFNHLDHNHIEQNDTLENVAPYDKVGVFYDFNHEPKCITFENAIEAGKGKDAIFSINPGKLAVCFFHDSWNFVCKR